MEKTKVKLSICGNDYFITTDDDPKYVQEIGLEKVGAPGTTAALALLNDQVKKGGVMASSYVGGLSGAFIPVSEDEGMIAAAKAGLIEGNIPLDELATKCGFSSQAYFCYKFKKMVGSSPTRYRQIAFGRLKN